MPFFGIIYHVFLDIIDEATANEEKIEQAPHNQDRMINGLVFAGWSKNYRIQKEKTMANGEIVKQETSALSLDFGTLSLDGLNPEQQNAIRALVAQKKFDLALKVAEGKIKLDASKADMDNVINTAQQLDRTKAGYSIHSEHETASGKTTISVSRVKFNPFG